MWFINKLLIGSLLIYSTTLWGQVYDFSVEHITKTSGLSNLEITSIVQDKDGFIWIGTRYGLNKYDGYSIEVFESVPGDSTSISDNNITCLYVARDGNLWVGTENMGVSIFDKKLNRFHNFTNNPLTPNSLSNNYVTCIEEDNEGNIWVGTEMGLNKFNKEEKTFHRYFRSFNLYIDKSVLSSLSRESIPEKALSVLSSFIGQEVPFDTIRQALRKVLSEKSFLKFLPLIYNQADKTNAGYSIKSLEMGTNHHLWFGFNDNKIGYLNTSDGSVEVNEIEKASGRGKFAFLNLLWHENSLWIGTTDAGLIRYDPAKETFDTKDINFINKIIKCVFKDSNQNILIGSEDGINVFQINDNTFQEIKDIKFYPDLLSSDVSAILEDEQGNFWIGSYQGGVNLLRHPRNVKINEVQNVISPFGSQDVSALLEDQDQNLWIGYFTSGIDLFGPDKKNNKQTFNPFQNCRLGNGTVFTIYEDSKKNIWVGTYGGGIQRYDKSSGRFLPLASMPSLQNDVRGLCEDQDQNLWIGFHGGGLGVYNLITEEFKQYKADYNHADSALSSDWINVVFCDNKNRVWIGSVNGVTLYDKETKKFKTFNTSNSNLSHNKVLSITADKRGNIWIGTENGLNIYSDNKKKFTILGQQNGLSSNFIASLVKDKEGNIWVGTYNGLSRIDPVNLSIKSYININGSFVPEFSVGAGLLSANGLLYFGSKDGLISAQPIKNPVLNREPRIVITNFKIIGNSVKIEEGSPLKQSISETSTIQLTHNQNSIGFEFTSPNYIDTKQTTYSYKLEGLYDQWISIGSNREINFTNLAPGNYRLHLRAKNSDNVMTTQPTTLDILITPPFWMTSYAKVFYLVLIITVLFLARLEFIRRLKLRNKFELDELKIRLFANISHEIRTPLALILAPLQHLMRTQSKEDQHELISIMDINGQRLLRLTNQLLNIYEIDAGVMKLKASENDLIRFMHNLYKTFQFDAARRKIKYEFVSTVKELVCFFDTDKVEKIISNILGNAFKYCQDGDSIKLHISSVSEDDKLMIPVELQPFNGRIAKIEVIDSGTGIAPDYQKRIFDRFFRVESKREIIGNGIGLALAYQLAKIHKGTITLSSQIDKGSLFTVWIPVDVSCYKSEEIDNSRVTLFSENIQLFAEENITDRIKDKELPILLIIEDNEDVIYFFQRVLNKEFQILSAPSAEKGIDIAFEVVPDIIICDVILPNMNGFEVCTKVKTDKRTSHIPLILLTGLPEDENKLKGLVAGADDYIVKPFSSKILVAKLKNALAIRKNLREKLRKEFDGFLEGSIKQNDKDEFLSKVCSIVEENISNCDFGVELLCQKIGMSQSGLYRKFSASLGISANHFIKKMRLQKAMQLMHSNQNFNVSEIAYQVGFKDPKYFSKTFKKEYGFLPGTHVLEIRNQTN